MCADDWHQDAEKAPRKTTCVAKGCIITIFPCFGTSRGNHFPHSERVLSVESGSFQLVESGDGMSRSRILNRILERGAVLRRDAAVVGGLGRGNKRELLTMNGIGRNGRHCTASGLKFCWRLVVARGYLEHTTLPDTREHSSLLVRVRRPRESHQMLRC